VYLLVAVEEFSGIVHHYYLPMLGWHHSFYRVSWRGKKHVSATEKRECKRFAADKSG